MSPTITSYNDELIHNHLFLGCRGIISYSVLVKVLSMSPRLCRSSGCFLTYFCTHTTPAGAQPNNFRGLGRYPQWRWEMRNTAEQMRTFWKNLEKNVFLMLVQDGYLHFNAGLVHVFFINLLANRHVSYFVLFTEVFKRFLV